MRDRQARQPVRRRVAADITTAVQRANACDPVSAFGGIVALNRPSGRRGRAALAPVFTEVVVAPGYDDDALATLTAKTNLRVLSAAAGRAGRSTCARSTAASSSRPRTVADRPVERGGWSPSAEPTAEQWDDLEFAWTVCAAVSSNAIVWPKDRQAFGIGAGQQNRVDSARIAAERAGGRAVGGVVRERRFFPFRDGLDVAAAAGVAAVIQPGGSVRDAEVIAAADEHGMAMVFTGERHFRH